MKYASLSFAEYCGRVDGLNSVSTGDVSDPYVNVYLRNALGEDRIAKTKAVTNNLSPVWNEEMLIDVCHEADFLVFEVKDKDEVLFPSCS